MAFQTGTASFKMGAGYLAPISRSTSRRRGPFVQERCEHVDDRITFEGRRVLHADGEFGTSRVIFFLYEHTCESETP
jgi:hypothetical protein